MPDGESRFHPIVKLPDEYWVFDFTKPTNVAWECPFPYQIGRYDEHRPGMYTTELFGGVRDLHVGLDIGAPVSTDVYAFADGRVYSFGINPEAGSYGPTIITEHELQLPSAVGSSKYSPPQKFWVLHGHLSTESLDNLQVGDKITQGQKIATIGNEYENGGWPPHIHIQISIEQPVNNDLPGVVRLSDREQALVTYPDPRLIVGQVY